MIQSASYRTTFLAGRLSAFFLSFIVLMAMSLAPAQILTGTLTGLVTDSTDAVVPNALVTATDTGSGLVYKEKTNASGEYTFTNLPNSTYKLTVEFPGFSKMQVDNVHVDVSQTAHIAVKLQIASTGTEVVVDAQQTALQSESAELKDTVDNAQLVNMPLPTRNPLDLVKSFAGIMTPNTGAPAVTTAATRLCTVCAATTPT